MNNLTEGGSVLAQLASELLNDERVVASSERGLLSKVLDDSRAESTGNAELDAAVARRLVSAAVGSMGERIVNALADEVVRQLVGRKDPNGEQMSPPAGPVGGGGDPVPRAPTSSLMMQVSPYNPGNPPTGQVSPYNPGNPPTGQVSPYNQGNNPPYL